VSRTTDVCFVFPSGLCNKGEFAPHLGVGYLLASLQAAGMKVQQFTHRSPLSIPQAAARILESKPPIVGLTIYDSNAGPCYAMAEAIKQARPETWVVCGGPASTFSSQHILAACQAVDLCVLGEAEEAGYEIMCRLLNTTPDQVETLADLPGVAFRTADAIQKNDILPLAGKGETLWNRLDTSPSPYLSGILKDGGSGILTGRGCTHNCVYCCFAALARKKLRYHSIERVIEELTAISINSGARGTNQRITIFDDAFTISPKRAKKICEALIKSKLKLHLACITRADTVDQELLRLMRKAGFKAVAFGLESAAPSVLRAIGKVRPPETDDPGFEPEIKFLDNLQQAVHQAHALGLVVGVSMMVGLPRENLEHATKTMDFIKQLPIDYYMHNVLSVFPGTPLWENQHQFGIESSPSVLGLPSTSKLPFDVRQVVPAPKSNRADEATLIRQFAREGLYACGAPNTYEHGLSMVVIHDDEIQAETAQWLALNLSLGGTVLQVCRNATPEDTLRLLRSRNLLLERHVPVRFHIQLVPEAPQGDVQPWRIVSEISSTFEVHHQELVTLREDRSSGSFTAWLNGEPFSADVAPPPADSNETGRATRQAFSTIPPLVPYPGRWWGREAPCLNMSRLEIDADQQIRMCRNGPIIGVVGEPFERLRQRMLSHMQALGSRRCPCSMQSLTPPVPANRTNIPAECGQENHAPAWLKKAIVFGKMPGMMLFNKDARQ